VETNCTRNVAPFERYVKGAKEREKTSLKPKIASLDYEQDDG
jgi:hypothetical protein